MLIDSSIDSLRLAHQVSVRAIAHWPLDVTVAGITRLCECGYSEKCLLMTDTVLRLVGVDYI